MLPELPSGRQRPAAQPKPRCRDLQLSPAPAPPLSCAGGKTVLIREAGFRVPHERLALFPLGYADHRERIQVRGARLLSWSPFLQGAGSGAESPARPCPPAAAGPERSPGELGRPLLRQHSPRVVPWRAAREHRPASFLSRRPSGPQLLTSRRLSAAGKDATLRYVAECTGIWETDDPNALAALSPFHCWKDGALQARFGWQPGRAITVVELRAFRRPSPVQLAVRTRAAPCVSGPAPRAARSLDD